tara:strand:+ start:4050 stop:5162 length:1113 start_codon:yes stop_codon:yes gene_type:complete
MSKRKRQLIEEPFFNSKAEDIEWEFFSCVNTYRTMGVTTSKEKKWVADYMKWKKYSKEDIDFAQKGNSFNFEIVAPCCRICTQSDCDAPPQWKKKIDEHIRSMIRVGKSKKEERDLRAESKPIKIKISIQDRIKNQVGEYLESLNVETDKFLDNIKKKPKFDIAAWLKNREVKSVQSSMIAEEFEPTLQELNDAYDKKDEQLVEGYDFLTRPQLKKFRDLIKEIIDTCRQHSKLSKAVRKPRRKKSRTPGQIIKKLQYCEKSDEYGVSSIDPRKIVGANKVVVFNTKYKKLAIFEASPLVDGLSVKGTTIVGFDDKKSREKTVRKPQEIIKDCATSGIRVINNRYNSLKTKEKVPTGRINKHCVLLQALK